MNPFEILQIKTFDSDHEFRSNVSDSKIWFRLIVFYGKEMAQEC